MILCLQKIKFLLDSFTIFRYGEFEWLSRLRRTLKSSTGKRENENLIKEEEKMFNTQHREQKRRARVIIIKSLSVGSVREREKENFI